MDRADNEVCLGGLLDPQGVGQSLGPALGSAVVEGYREVACWKLDRRTTVIANLVGIAVLPLALGLFAFAAGQIRRTPPGEILLSLGNMVADLPGALLVLASLWGVVVFHEATHGAVMRLFGRRPVFGLIHGGLAAYASAPGQPFTRDQWATVALAPLVLLTGAGCAALPILPPDMVGVVVFALAANAAGAGADIWLAARALRFPRGARVVDEPDRIRVLLPYGGNGAMAGSSLLGDSSTPR